MEEADLLADNVAILCNGELSAFGTPLDLKTKYGSALQLSIICEKDDVAAVEAQVKRAFRESLSYVEFESSTSGYCTLTIKKVYKAAIGQAVYDKDGGREGVSITELGSFIGWCEDENSPVQEFGISNSSLEEVFLSVTHGFSPAVAQLEQERRGCCGCRKKGPGPRTSSEADVSAVLASTNVLFSQNVNQEHKVDIASYSRKLSVLTQVKAIFRFQLARSWATSPASIINWTVFSIFSAASMITGEPVMIC